MFELNQVHELWEIHTREKMNGQEERQQHKAEIPPPICPPYSHAPSPVQHWKGQASHRESGWRRGSHNIVLPGAGEEWQKGAIATSGRYGRQFSFFYGFERRSALFFLDSSKCESRRVVLTRLCGGEVGEV